MKIVQYFVIALAVALIIPYASANPYIGGYPNNAVVKATRIQGYSDFKESTVTGLDNWVGSVLSTGGWESTTAAHPTGWIYQITVVLLTSGTMRADAEVWQGSTQRYDCDPNCPSFGDFSTVDYTLSKMYWSASNSQVTYEYEVHRRDTSVDFYYATYTKTTDNSNYFSAGVKNPCGCGSYIVKFLQFGIETGGSTDSWVVKQYSMGYVDSGGLFQQLKDYASYSLTVNQLDYNYHSIVTYVYNSQENSYTYYQVGTALLSADADYPLKPGSTLQAGTVKWFHTAGFPLSAGTRLW